MENKASSYLIQLLLVIIISSCNSNDKKTISNNKKEISSHQFAIPKVFFKKFRVSLSNNKILNLYLTKSVNVINGVYGDTILSCVIDDSNSNKPRMFTGEMTPNGSFKFKNNKGGISISGKFLSVSKIKIKYLDLQKGFFSNIELVEIKEEFKIFPENYYKEEFETNTGEAGCDSTRFFINLSVPVFKSKENNSDKIINNVIKQDIGLKTNETYEEFIKLNLPHTFGYFVLNIDVVYLDNNFLTLQEYTREAHCGAAHGDWYISYINLDLEANTVIKLEDIFQKKYLKKLKIICKQKFKEKYNLQEENLEKFYLQEDFALYRNGISLLFQPYGNGIGIYTGGTTEVFIPFAELSDLMNPNTILTNRLLNRE